MRRILLMLGLLLFSAASVAQDQRPLKLNLLATIQREVYKRVGEVELEIYKFEPRQRREGADPAAMVFFFGGGWQAGSPAQFIPQCEYLASRGMMAFAVDYRVASRHQAKVVDCIADAKSAIRWVRAGATRLHIDPKRIVAAGGSAGGHLAACTALLDEFDEPQEDQSVSSVPNALVLFNPAVVLAPIEGIELGESTRRLEAIQSRFGVEAARVSPYHHVHAGIGPMLVLHGKADQVVPYRTVELFAEAMTKAGNQCRLIGYEGQPHGFFNARKNQKEYYEATTRAMDKFLVSIGYLEGEPTIGSD